jgi:hypothetical protein
MKIDQIYAALEAHTDECIEFDGYLNPQGYGQLRHDGRMCSAHRVTLQLATGLDGDGFHAAHQPIVCHNTSCINPRHLRWATPSENMSDRTLDGTNIDGQEWTRGSGNGRSTLHEAQVLDIFERVHRVKRSGTQLADEYGVTRGAVSDIKTGRTWSHLTERAAA